VHLTQQRRTHVGAAFRPIAELDPGAITGKNRLGSLGNCDGDQCERGGHIGRAEKPDLAHAA
jgi:hypothetical protein